MNISKVAKATGLTAKTIRYYEHRPISCAGAQRQRGTQLQRRCPAGTALRQAARETGFNLEECQELLALYRTSTEPVPR